MNDFPRAPGESFESTLIKGAALLENHNKIETTSTL